MICAPVSTTARGVMPLTEPYVPTGMNAGVSIVPRDSVMRPRRAGPSEATSSNFNAVIAPTPSKRSSFVMRPHAQYLHGLLGLDDRVDKSVLDVDAARVGSGQIADQFF